jgi:hypothetical protein
MTAFSAVWREWHLYRRSSRLPLIFVFALGCLLVAGWLGTQRVQAQAVAQEAALHGNRQAWLNQAPASPHAVTHRALLVLKPVAPLARWVEGHEPLLGRHVFLDSHRVIPPAGSTGAALPLAQWAGSLDAPAVVSLLLSLVFLLEGLAVVTRDREHDTLGLVVLQCSAPTVWLARRALVRLVSLLGVVLAAAFLATLPFPVMAGTSLSQVAMLLLLALDHLTVWFLVGMVCSLTVREPRQGLWTCLLVWVALVLVLPRVQVSVLRALDPAPSSLEARLTATAAENRIRADQEREVSRLLASGALDGKPDMVQAEGPQEVRDRYDDAVERTRREAEAPLNAWRDRQQDRLRRLTWMAPGTAFGAAVAEVSGTGFERHRAFVEQADRYRTRVLDRLNGLEEAGMVEFRDFESIPVFTFSEPGTRAWWPAACTGLATLATQAFILCGLVFRLARSGRLAR